MLSYKNIKFFAAHEKLLVFFCFHTSVRCFLSFNCKNFTIFVTIFYPHKKHFMLYCCGIKKLICFLVCTRNFLVFYSYLNNFRFFLSFHQKKNSTVFCCQTLQFFALAWNISWFLLLNKNFNFFFCVMSNYFALLLQKHQLFFEISHKLCWFCYNFWNSYKIFHDFVVEQKILSLFQCNKKIFASKRTSDVFYNTSPFLLSDSMTFVSFAVEQSILSFLLYTRNSLFFCSDMSTNVMFKILH